MASKQDVLQEIDDCTAACVEDSRSGPFFEFNWLGSRRHYTPVCKDKCNKQFAADLSAVQQQDSQLQQATQTALLDQFADGNKSLFKIIGIVFIFLLIIAIIVS